MNVARIECAEYPRSSPIPRSPFPRQTRHPKVNITLLLRRRRSLLPHHSTYREQGRTAGMYLFVRVYMCAAVPRGIRVSPSEAHPSLTVVGRTPPHRLPRQPFDRDLPLLLQASPLPLRPIDVRSWDKFCCLLVYFQSAVATQIPPNRRMVFPW